MAATALLATASAINATLYAATEIGYTMAKEGNLPKIYEYNIFHSTEGLIVSALLIVPMVLFLNLAQVTTVAALVVLIIQGVTHIAHLFRIKDTGANAGIVTTAAVAMFGIAALTLYHTYQTMPEIGYYLLLFFAMAFIGEVLLRLFTDRIVSKQVEALPEEIIHIVEEALPFQKRQSKQK